MTNGKRRNRSATPSHMTFGHRFRFPSHVARRRARQAMQKASRKRNRRT